MVENATRIEGYLRGMDKQSFSTNGLVGDAVERCLERICEAAHRLGPEATLLMPSQPWADIRGMGNKLRHAYDRIAADVIWETVHRDIPSLASDARRALALIDRSRGGLDGDGVEG